MTLFTRRARAAVAVLAIAVATPALGATPTAMSLLYETPFLDKVEVGTTLSYHFVRTSDDPALAPSFQDDLKLSMSIDDGTRIATVRAFSGPRTISSSHRSLESNPIAVVVFENDITEMNKVLGGSPFYFKNRILEAIRNTQDVEPAKIEYAGRTLDGWKIVMKPFANTPHGAKLRAFAERSYEIIMSEEVPGGIFRIRTVTPRPGDPAKPLLVEDVTLTSVKATEVKP